MAFCVVSYTSFVIVMFTSNSNGAWVQNEAVWASDTTQYVPTSYVNNDPNA